MNKLEAKILKLELNLFLLEQEYAIAEVQKQRLIALKIQNLKATLCRERIKLS